MGVLQRFERRLEGMVGLAFARLFKGKVHPAEIAKALQREADEQRSVVGEGRILAPNVYVVRLGDTDYEHLGQWSDQLAGELADMVAEHIDDEGYSIFDAVRVHLDTCNPCLEKYDLQRTVKMVVARSCAETAPADLRDRVRLRIREVQVRITEG